MKNQSQLPLVGALATIAAFVYLTVVLVSKTIPLNPATWILWSALDIFLCYNMWKNNNPAKLIVTGFTLGACTIMIMAISQIMTGKTSWSWSIKETITLMCFLLAFTINMLSSNQKLSLNMCTTAMFIAGVPSVIDAWSNPKSADPLFWGLCALGSFITLTGTPKGFTNRYMPAGGTVLNGLIAVLAMVR